MSEVIYPGTHQPHPDPAASKTVQAGATFVPTSTTTVSKITVEKDGSHVVLWLYGVVEHAGGVHSLHLTAEEADDAQSSIDGAVFAVRDEELTELGLQATGFDVYGEEREAS